MKTCIALLTTALCVLPYAHATEYEKNGMPCVAEVCIGDGLADLQKVKWNPVMADGPRGKPIHISEAKFYPGWDEIARKEFRGKLDKAMPYLISKKFDNRGLVALAEVKAVCVVDPLGRVFTGTYTTQSGNSTEVTLALTSKDVPPDQQRWTVTRIDRTIPAAVSKEQQQKVVDELYVRYRSAIEVNKAQAMPVNNPSLQHAPEWTSGVDISAPYGGGVLLTLKVGGKTTEYMRHPLCGGSTNVSPD